MTGAGGAMRATGWRATAIRFQRFGEGGRVHRFSPLFARARRWDADDGHWRRDAR